MSETIKAYISGFLDADGSIYIRIKPNETYRFNYQIAPYVVFYQKRTQASILEKIKDFLEVGYIRHRKDDIVEYVIGDEVGLRKVISVVKNYVILKREQIEILERVLDLKSSAMTAQKFLQIVALADRFASLNYSKKRIQRQPEITKEFKKRGLL